MSGSNVVAVKVELIRRLSEAPELAGVQVVYSYPRDLAREVIYGGAARVSHSLTAMRGGTAARLPRDEQVVLGLHIAVRNLQSDAAAGDERAVELVTVVEELLAGDPTLTGFPDLLLAGVTGVELLQPVFDDDGITSGINVEVSYRSYLT